MKTLEDFLFELSYENIKFGAVDREHGWIIIPLLDIDCEKMIAVGNVIKSFFYEEEKYTHKLPKMIGYKNTTAIIFDYSLLNKV